MYYITPLFAGYDPKHYWNTYITIDWSVSCTHSLMNKVQTTVSWGNLPIMKFIPACLLHLTHCSCQYSVTGPSGYLASQDLHRVCVTKTHNTHYTTLSEQLHMVWTHTAPLYLLVSSVHLILLCLIDWLGSGWVSNKSASQPCSVEMKNIFSWHIVYDIMESHLSLTSNVLPQSCFLFGYV